MRRGEDNSSLERSDFGEKRTKSRLSPPKAYGSLSRTAKQGGAQDSGQMSGFNARESAN